jgi:hypothetical protein
MQKRRTKSDFVHRKMHYDELKFKKKTVNYYEEKLKIDEFEKLIKIKK